MATTGTDANHHRYGGKFGYYTDGPNGIMLALNRWYHPSLMRWLSRDPILYEGGTNLYEYVGGNPVRFVDPSGLDWLDTLGDFSAGFGDEISFGLTKYIRKTINDGRDPANESSEAYNMGGWAGVGWTCAAAPTGAARAAGWTGRIAIHNPHHYFPSLGRKAWHLQLNVWKVGVKRSGRAWRWPLF